jgi:DNA replication protein DnaC
VILAGPPGIGKTHLAVALGVKAVENAFSVAFYRLEDLMHAMKVDVDIPTRRLRQKKYRKVSLLIVDEVGLHTGSYRIASARTAKPRIPSLPIAHDCESHESS